MTSGQKKYEKYVESLVESGGEKGVERIKPTDPQAKAVIDNHKTCAICSIMYTDKPDIFEIHHIDGKADNTQTRNLALICANCHKQVHTESNRILKDSRLGNPYPIRPFLSSLKENQKGNTTSQMESVTCVYCRGTGKEEPFLGTVCRICKGTGENTIKKSAKTCVYCHGSGKEEPFMGTICRVCKGKGYV
jgi:hypothetical protein